MKDIQVVVTVSDDHNHAARTIRMREGDHVRIWTEDGVVHMEQTINEVTQ